MIRAILWDNDGVLVDTEMLFFETTRTAFASMGLVLTKEIWVEEYFGKGKASREVALSLGGDPERIPWMLAERNQRYLQALSQPPPVRPRVRETLAAFSNGFKMAIVTDCRREQLDLMHRGNGLLAFFDSIVTGEGSFCKPHPAPYQAAMKALDVNPGSCIAVEDSPKGLASARAAGIFCVIVPTELTRHLEFAGASAVEQDVSGLLKYI